MAEHPNAAVIRRGYEAFAKGDMGTLTDIFHEDAVWHNPPGRSPVAGDFQGRDATFAMFAKLAELSEGSYRLEAHDVLADDEHAVGLHRATGARQGQSLAGNHVVVFHVRNGKIAEGWYHSDDSQAYDRFWSA